MVGTASEINSFRQRYLDNNKLQKQHIEEAVNYLTKKDAVWITSFREAVLQVSTSLYSIVLIADSSFSHS